MKAIDIPTKFPKPFADSAGVGYKNAIPEASQIGITDGRASLTDGFPPLNFTQLVAGGVPPFGGDVNGLFFQVTDNERWKNAGGSYPFDSAFSTAIGGYPKGSVILNDALNGLFVSLVDDNTVNPNSGTSANWASWSPRGIVNTFADLATAVPAFSGQIIDTKGYSVAGIGASSYVDVTGSAANDNVTIVNNTLVAGHYWKKINYSKITARDGGAIEDGTTSDNTAILNVYPITKNIQIDAPTVCTLTIAQHGNAVYRGDGTFVTDPYVKHVIPDNAKSDNLDCIDYLPSKHGRHVCGVSTPVVCLVGDSIATLMANSISIGNMLSNVLSDTLQKQFPNGVTFLNRAISGQSWGSLTADLHSASIDWYPSAGTWQARVAADNPDLVIFAFGMNDSAGISLTAMKNAIDYFKALTKPPSIIVCTNLSPNGVSASATPDGKTAMEGRQAAAGFERSYVKWRNNGKDAGLIDINRKYNMAQNGFDPINTVLKVNATPITPVALGGGSFSYTAPQQCSDWQVLPNWDDSNTGFGIVIQTGTDAGDFIQITRNATQLGIAIYAQSQLLYGAFQAHTFDNTTDTHFVIEKRGNYISIHKTNNAALGGYTAPLFYQRLVSNGGIYDAKVVANGMTSVKIYTSEYVWNEPSVRMDELWGVDGGPNLYGGSGWNHPSEFVGSHVYRQVIEATKFYESIVYGDVIESTVGAVSIGTGGNSVLTTVVLSYGQWDVSGVVNWLPAGGASVTQIRSGVTSAGTSFGGLGTYVNESNVGVATTDITQVTPTVRISVTGTTTTTMSLTVRPTYTGGGSMQVSGYIKATRVA